MNVSIVIPVYNERDNVEELCRSIEKKLHKLDFTYEIIFVDDGSTDGTWNVIEKLKTISPHLKGIKLKRNYGQTNAMVAGFDQTEESLIVTMGGDVEFPSMICYDRNSAIVKSQ
jgi:glycosyltransferase involved in cell wall biosynthesis